MTSEKLLENLKSKRNLINQAIELIELELQQKETKQKAKAIIKSIKPHWTQLPKNRAKIKRILKSMAKKKRERAKRVSNE